MPRESSITGARKADGYRRLSRRVIRTHVVFVGNRFIILINHAGADPTRRATVALWLHLALERYRHVTTSGTRCAHTVRDAH